MKTKTYDLLIRVSAMGKRDADDESTRTIDDQQRAGHTTAKSKSGRIGKTYEMLDQSGSNVLPLIQGEIIERIESGKSAGLIVAYSDRLCRNAEDGIAFLGAMGRADAELWDATSPDVDYRDDDGRLVWLMKMVVNEIPSRAAKKRGQRLADELAADGIPTKVSLGYRRNADALGVKTLPDRPDKSLVVDEATAPVVRRIFAMRLDAYSWVVIADTLNDEGIPSPSGKRWGPSSVAAVIANEVYTGVVKIGTRRCENAHEAIIPAAQWRAVQSTIKQTRTGRLVAGIAGGIVVCQTCGLTLSVVGTGRDGRAMYGCRRRSAHGKCSQPVYVTKDAADKYVEKLVVELIVSGEGVDLVASAREIETARLQLDAAVRAARRRS
jgi:Site-specific recombinases, DNA invertase Pin homologs